MKKLTNCRNCKENNFKKIFSLGELSYSGKFSKNNKINIAKEYLTLVMCKSCTLIQLDRNFNPKYMYASDYGYRSGINQTMKDHLKLLAGNLSKRVNLKKNDAILDIASNDATLLNSYSMQNLIKVGVDPILNKFKKEYVKIDYKINNFFNYSLIKKLNIKNNFKIITAISMFYDLPDPNKFLNDIEKILDKKNGIFLLEQVDLYSIIKYNLFDTICHEHLEYYSFKVIEEMLNNNNLKIIDVERNLTNGGSIRFYISSKESIYKKNLKRINKIKMQEKLLRLDRAITYKKFFKRVINIKMNLLKIIKNIKKKNYKICGYGASTKGNILLQFFGIDGLFLDHIADRNPLKNNFYTPGTKIKIIEEKKSRSLNPDYYLVLPWHFKKEILKREKKLIKSGTKFIFPLPKIEIINKKNVQN
tara:strand:+ start:5364 stop:6617 length:1254 start_codon:yes stop_codon:yes gene_type:complete